MFKKFLPILFLVLPACSSGPDAIADTCANINEASKMTYDCNAMAEKLSHYTKVLDKQINNIEVSSQDEHLKYTEALSPCMKYLDEIYFGVCGKDPGVQKAFSTFKINNP